MKKIFLMFFVVCGLVAASLSAAEARHGSEIRASIGFGGSDQGGFVVGLIHSYPQMDRYFNPENGRFEPILNRYIERFAKLLTSDLDTSQEMVSRISIGDLKKAVLNAISDCAKPALRSSVEAMSQEELAALLKQFTVSKLRIETRARTGAEEEAPATWGSYLSPTAWREWSAKGATKDTDVVELHRGSLVFVELGYVAPKLGWGLPSLRLPSLPSWMSRGGGEVGVEVEGAAAAAPGREEGIE
jgi:hypothetical protein